VPVIANDLHIDGVPHFAIPVVLFDSSFWNLTGCAIKNHHYAINAKCKARQVKLGLQTGGRFLHFLISGHVNILVLQQAQLIRYPLNGQPGSFLGNSTTQASNASEMTGSIEIESNANLLHRGEWAPPVVHPAQVENFNEPQHRIFVEPEVRLEFCITESYHGIQTTVDRMWIPCSHSLSVCTRKVI
jgi:hypothetical protein